MSGKSQQQGSLRALKITLVSLDCLFVGMPSYHSLLPSLSPSGMQPILVHMSKDAHGKFSYNPVSVNLMTEIFKVIFAIFTLTSVVTQFHSLPSPMHLI